MKKITSLILALALLCGAMLTLASCGSGYPIGVQGGTTAEFFVNGDEEWEFPGVSGAQAKAYSNGGLAVNDLKNGAIKFVMIDEAPAKQLVKSITGVKVIDIALTEEEYAFGVDKAQPELREKIDAILVEKAAEINAIIATYFSDPDAAEAITSAKFDASKADAQLVVATNANFAPFEYKDGDKFKGIDMAIAKLIADELEMELVISDMEFESVVTSVGKNGVDVAMAGLTVNDTRKQSVDFTASYYNAAQMLIVAENDTTFDGCTTSEQVIAALEKYIAENK